MVWCVSSVSIQIFKFNFHVSRRLGHLWFEINLLGLVIKVLCCLLNNFLKTETAAQGLLSCEINVGKFKCVQNQNIHFQSIYSKLRYRDISVLIKIEQNQTLFDSRRSYFHFINNLSRVEIKRYNKMFLDST